MIIDETYEKYVSIAYNWSENKRLNYSVRVYDIRHEYLGDDEFYVIGIGVSDFLECNGHNSLKDCTNIENEIGKEECDNLKRIVKYLYSSNRVSIDDLYELSNSLKEAGAKQVYLHPSFYAVDVDDNVQECHPNTGEWLIVIPK